MGGGGGGGGLVLPYSLGGGVPVLPFTSLDQILQIL